MTTVLSASVLTTAAISAIVEFISSSGEREDRGKRKVERGRERERARERESERERERERGKEEGREREREGGRGGVIPDSLRLPLSSSEWAGSIKAAYHTAHSRPNAHTDAFLIPTAECWEEMGRRRERIKEVNGIS